MPALLLRDLAQVVTPAVDAAPLRGPALGELRLIENAYVLCDAGRILAVGHMGELDAGLALRLHADQFTEAGGVPLALELEARSVDHLEATGPDGVRALGASDVAAVLLPIAALYLGRPMPPGRALVDAGAIVALATDFNPGSAFSESLPVAMSLACTQVGLSPAEALAACTVNAAHVLGRADTLGRIVPGYTADLVLLDASDWRYLAYHLGGEQISHVVKEGEVVWER